MELRQIAELESLDETRWLQWGKEGFSISSQKPKHLENNRETLARLYVACVEETKRRQKITTDDANRFVRSIWIEEGWQKRSKNIPRIFGEDGFLHRYLEGVPVSLTLFKKIWGRLSSSSEERVITLNPINVQWNEGIESFFDVDATPPGFLPKLYMAWRLKKDEELLKQIAHDLELISRIEDRKKRTLLTLAVLSHGAAYRELDGKRIQVPSFEEPRKLITYVGYQHLIAEGLKTISLEPTVQGAPGIYVCQGTELWPSQPSVLGSILANFAMHGSATEAYAHSWRRIHKHLRDLKRDSLDPIVCGHSMGGAMAIQIGLFSHDLVDQIWAFNPPVSNDRDYEFYQHMSEEERSKIFVVANQDDFAFWRIGAKVIGNVTLFLGKRRWRYYHVSVWDCLLIFPAFVKFILNVRHAFPAHQRIIALSDNYLSVELTQEEIEKENMERTHRFDYLHFFPKLYDPVKTLMHYVRRFFGWSLEDAYLCSEIEVITLLEEDLIDTITAENKEEIEHELEELRRQKARLQKRLKRIRP